MKALRALARASRRAWAIASLAVLAMALTAIATPASPPSSPDAHLLQGLVEIGRGEAGTALRRLDFLTRNQPDFRLAQLVYGDLLVSRIASLTAFGPSASSARIEDLRAEAKSRVLRRAAGSTGRLPRNLLQVPANVSAAIVIDLTSYRLHLFESREGQAEAVADVYASIGKGGVRKQREGDERTPVGVYRVTSYIPGERLPDLYGAGAFPMDYPNLWDRRLGRTGSGIWIHGTPSDTYNRPPRSSRGCVTVSNSNFKALSPSVEVGRTPVILTDGIEWRTAEEIEAERSELLAAFEGWRSAWESLDTDAYLAFYSSDFRSGSMDLEAWRKHKARVNAAKSFIEVEIEELGLFRYPGEEDLVLAEFRQRYESSNFKSTSRKRQFWRLEEGEWKIVGEGSR